MGKRRIKPSERKPVEPPRKRRRGVVDEPPPDQTPPDPEQTSPFEHLRNPNQRIFLRVYCQCWSITQAAEASGLSIWAHYYWKRTDALYRRAFFLAWKIAGDRCEEEAYRRAVTGLRRLKFGPKGKPLIDPATRQPYVEHEFSDRLLERLLKAFKPHRYCDRQETQHNVSVDSPAQGSGGMTDLLKTFCDTPPESPESAAAP